MLRAIKLTPAQLAYKELIKDPVVKSKAESIISMNNILKLKRVPDDLKLKLYRQSFNKYKRIKGEMMIDTDGFINSMSQLPRGRPWPRPRSL